MDEFKKYLNANFVLGSGTFGKIYKVKDQNGKWLALKQQNQEDFLQFSKVLIESSFHLLFPADVPLLPLLNIFVQKNSNTRYPFTISLLMEKGKSDLSKIINNSQNQPLTFF